MEINTRFIKFSGRFEVLPGLINPEEEVDIKINGMPYKCSHAKTEHHNLQDGTYDEIYVFKPV